MRKKLPYALFWARPLVENSRQKMRGIGVRRQSIAGKIVARRTLIHSAQSIGTAPHKADVSSCSHLMPRLPPSSTGILHSALFTRTQSSVDEGPALDSFLNTLHRVLLFFLLLRGPWRSQILRPIRRFSPLAEDLHLGIERRFPAPINLSIQALMEDKIDHPRPWKIDRISLIGLLVQFRSAQYAVLYH